MSSPKADQDFLEVMASLRASQTKDPGEPDEDTIRILRSIFDAGRDSGLEEVTQGAKYDPTLESNTIIINALDTCDRYLNAVDGINACDPRLSKQSAQHWLNSAYRAMKRKRYGQ